MNFFHYLPWVEKPRSRESKLQTAGLGEILAGEAISSAKRDDSLESLKIKMSSIYLPREGGDATRRKFARLKNRGKSTYKLPNKVLDGQTDKTNHSHESLGKDVEVFHLSGALANKLSRKHPQLSGICTGDDTISNSESGSHKVVLTGPPVFQETQGSNITNEDQKSCQSCIKLRDSTDRADSAAPAKTEKLKYTELQFNREKTKYLDEAQRLRQLNHDQYLQIQSLQKDLAHYTSHNKHLISQARSYEVEFQKLREAYDMQTQNLARNEREIGKLQRIELAKFRPSDVLLDEQARTSIFHDFFSKIRTISRVYFRGMTWQDITRSYNFVSPGTGPPSVFELPWIPAHWPIINSNSKISSQVLLGALISCTLGERLFQDPFFQLDGDEVKSFLELLYSEAAKRKILAAEMWKAKTVDLISQTKNEVLKAAESDDPPNLVNSVVLIDQLYNQMSEILVGLLRGRLRHSSFDMESQVLELRNDLLDLIQSSAQLAEDWHKREFRLQVIDIHWLHKKGVCWNSENAERYVTCSPKSRKLKEGVEYKILAVISPGFIRYENGDDEGKEMEIVWQRAAVFLEEAKIIALTDGTALSPMEM